MRDIAQLIDRLELQIIVLRTKEDRYYTLRTKKGRGAKEFPNDSIDCTFRSRRRRGRQRRGRLLGVRLDDGAAPQDIVAAQLQPGARSVSTQQLTLGTTVLHPVTSAH